MKYHYLPFTTSSKLTIELNLFQTTLWHLHGALSSLVLFNFAVA
jgi:hypothetical protein